MEVRLIEAGTVPHLRSQSLYHGLAYARGAGTPDTVVVAVTGEPYVCVGYHQDAEHEVDLELCRRRGLPVVRRETGGGAVYLDRDQVFVQWIMGPDSLPARLEERFALFARPIVAAYRELGVAAQFRPVNDVHVGARKITGTGAARIGDAEVLVGNFLLDFDTALMARILRSPSAAYRRQVERSLRAYMTSMRAELGAAPDPAAVAAAYRRHCAEALGRPLEPGALTAAEEAAIARVEQRLGSDAFVCRPGGMRRGGVKIHQDVFVCESAAGAGGGTLRATARLREGRIEEVALSASGTARRTHLARLERALRGVELQRDPVTRAVRSCGEDGDAWVHAILDLHTPTGRAER